ncbi:MAG: ubiquinol-cytochrome c reductase iron-sulfur subunit [Rhodospirillaceae bacterium]|nr:ubiquinol-cytochrome c reductase iron-sulfur subunit [Rhodospirillaceae bacterium]
MSDDTQDHDGHSGSRRDFLYLSAGAFGGVGGAIALWPFVHSLNPAADVLALSTIEVDVSQVEVGQRVTVKWQGKPVFIDHRTETAIEEARDTPLSDLRDPQPDESRAERPDWLVVIGVCTHLGCVPKGQKPSENRGDWGGWFCPCHASHYDTSGRIRKGPAPLNLPVPPLTFLNDTTIKIGRG